MNSSARITRKNSQSVLAVLTTVVSAFGVAGAVPAVFVPGMFGSLDSHGDGLTTIAVGSLAGFPIVCAASFITSWILWRKQRHAAAFRVMVLPPFSILLLFIVLLWLSY